ncbi:MAG: preprotein translocase subunit YajC [Verrucomicrobia bacterium]|nr:MAG: preprotein translocase subunit YajC [Verrucomicrobiota bacterium]
MPILAIFLAQAQPAAPAPIVIMYFVLIRPQKKRQQQQQRLVSSLKTGDRVVTNAGIHGLIANVKETTVIVKVADNVKIEMEKSAISNVLKTE